MKSPQPPTIRRMLTKTRDSARMARVGMESGISPAAAVANAELLELFDRSGEGFVDMTTIMDLTADERCRFALAACTDLERFCVETLTMPDDTWDWQVVVTEVAGYFRELATCLPEVVEAMCTAHRSEPPSIDTINLAFGLDSPFDPDAIAERVDELRDMLGRAVFRYGVEAVREAVESWYPDADQRRLLSHMVDDGRSVDAVRWVFTQAFAQAGMDLLDD